MANIKEAFDYASKNPNSAFAKNLEALAKSGALDAEAKKNGIDLSGFKTVEKTTLKEDLGERVFAIKEQFGQVAEAEGAEQALQVAQTPLRVAGQAAGAVGDIVGAGINKVTGGGLDKLSEAIANTESGKNLGAALSKFSQEYPELAAGLGDVFNVASVGVGTAAVKPVSKVAKTATKKAVAGAKTGATTIKEGIAPTPTFEKAIGEVSLAKPAELTSFEKALGAVDTSKVTTQADLKKVFDDAIPTIAKRVDDELAKDTGVYNLEALAVPQVTKAGKEIRTDYITRALDGLDELYTKLGDDVSKADIIDLKNKAMAEGLTRKEVNDLARTYNSEFADKAFTATGDIKSGFNAEVYESTRQGLKQAARAGIGGEEAKLLDESLSAIYDARRIAERNANAVNAMKQRIEEKGWIGKGVRGVFEASDMVTGGAVRALRDAVLARGAGLKLQNALELENKLQKNLEVINRALKAKTEKQAGEILKELKAVEPITE